MWTQLIRMNYVASRVRARGKRIRDNSLGCWNDTWLPISQFEITNDNTVTFTDPLMTIHMDELFVCVSRMSIMKFTGQPPPSATSSSLR